MIECEPDREIAAGINIGFFNRDVMIDRRMRALISVLIGATAPWRVRNHIQQEDKPLRVVIRVYDINIERVILAAIDVHILHVAIGGAADRPADDIAVLYPNIGHTIMIRSQLAYPNTDRCRHIAAHRHPIPARAMQESRY